MSYKTVRWQADSARPITDPPHYFGGYDSKPIRLVTSAGLHEKLQDQGSKLQRNVRLQNPNRAPVSSSALI
jgi:hypothetical protein